MFTDNERKTTETLILRQESITPDVVSNFSYDNTDETMGEFIILHIRFQPSFLSYFMICVMFFFVFFFLFI